MEKQEVNRQIEELRKQLKESYKKNRKQIWRLEEVLQQQVNKPKIEVGKIYKHKLPEGITMFCVKEIHENYLKAFGFAGDYYGNGTWYLNNTDSLVTAKEATKEEWEQALTKHADKLYECVEKVDRSGLDVMWKDIETFRPHLRNCLDGNGAFQYKGCFVMDKLGRWALPVIESKPELDYDIEIINSTLTYNPMAKYIEDGYYKLEKVG